MRNFLRNNLTGVLIVGGTIVMAGVAVFISIRLYQLRNQSVAPTAPESRPGAEALPTESCTDLSFSLTVASPTPTGSPTPTPSPTPTGSPSPTPTGSATPTASPTASPAPTTSPTSSPIAQATTTPTSAPTTTTTTTTATAAPQLPQAGVSLPTYAGIIAGIILVIGGILLVF